MGISSTSFKKGGIGYWRGKTRPAFSKKWKENISQGGMGNHNGFQKENKLSVGNKNTKWKGNDVGYGALHLWVRRWKGRPDTCEYCGRSGLKGRQIGWANTDHVYKRNLTDWIRLCRECHIQYDIKQNQYILFKKQNV